MYQTGQNVTVDLSGLQVGNVQFHAAVTDAKAVIIRQTSQKPATYLVKLLFSFRGVSELQVPESRIKP